MTQLPNNFSIAYAALYAARSDNYNPTGAKGRLIPATQVRLPGTGSSAMLKEMAEIHEMEFLDIRMTQIEFHPGAMDMEISERFERAVATGKSVMIVLDEADGAEAGLLESAMKIVEARIEKQTCVLFAITSGEAEQNVVARMGEGLGINPDRIMGRHFLDRTIQEAVLAEQADKAE